MRLTPIQWVPDANEISWLLDWKDMTVPSWNLKDQRQYEHVKESELDRGKTEDVAEEIAGRTVNKQRREEGRTPNKRTQGTGNPNKSLAERSVEELRNLASERKLVGRSRMKKRELVEALGKLIDLNT